MKFLLKIVFAPAIALLALFVWLCMGLLYCSSFVFGIAGTVIALLGVAVLITYSVQNGIILLVIAFLVSPVGLPMAAAWLLSKVQDLRYWIQDMIYG
ncbi:MAG: CD1845 family protein [Oscillospiraceae bacterium]|nr:CD1845 family protein [Oscillospiraceae bacterium]